MLVMFTMIDYCKVNSISNNINIYENEKIEY